MDTMTPEQRHRCMAAIKGKDTKPEMMVRRYLHARGIRYGLHNRSLPGSPDLVLRKYKTVIFIHGCFWHGHEGCRFSHLPKSNVEFWSNKIARNRQRDAFAKAQLEKKGWNVLTVWECDLKDKTEREKTLEDLINKLHSIGAEKYEIDRFESPAIAAEAEVPYGQ